MRCSCWDGSGDNACFAKNKSEGRRLDVVDARAVGKKNTPQHVPVRHWRSCWRNRGVFVSTRAGPRTEVEKLIPQKKGVGECCCDPASSSQDRIVERTVSCRKKSLAFPFHHLWAQAQTL